MEKTSVLAPGADGNFFGKVSHLCLTAAEKNGKTILQEVSFTAPYKIMHPFPQPDGSIQVMLLSASAGIMSGDQQRFELNIRKGASVEFLSQSYEKIHHMDKEPAERDVSIHVESGASFCYHPQPTIPFSGSAFTIRTRIDLDDLTSRFRMCEIFSCGRAARKEFFGFRFYHSLTQIFRSSVLIYRDNARYDPSLFDMNGLGMYESFTHLACVFLSRPSEPSQTLNKIREFLCEQTAAEGAATMLSSGDLVIRILGHRAQHLEELCSHILNMD